MNPKQEGLVERISETIDDYLEANRLTADDVMLVLEYCHAVVEQGTLEPDEIH